MDDLTRAGYLAHASLPSTRARLLAAHEVLRASPAHALSVSWGKDSVAMLALAVQIRPRWVVLNARYPNPAERFADMDRVRDDVLGRPALSQVRYVEVACPGEWEMYERAGRAFAEPETADERAAAHWWKSEFTSRMAAAQADWGCSGVCIGLRQEESRGRRLNIASRGVSYRRADGLAVALPMGRLTGADVWAIHTQGCLPALRIYDVAPDRERARSGFVWSTGAIGAVARHGGVDLWRRAYPEELRMWFARWPELERQSHG